MSQMAGVRWTIRSVDPVVIDRVRSVQDQTGFGLGEILSLSARYGIAAALTELTRQQPPRPINHRQMFARCARAGRTDHA